MIDRHPDRPALSQTILDREQEAIAQRARDVERAARLAAERAAAVPADVAAPVRPS